mgnify:CR=1 FL=1
MEREVNKFHALQLFTDTFSAETVHLTNEAVGIYIRLLCFAWTKNAKPFTTESAYRICQCNNNDCINEVAKVLSEFFIAEEDNKWTHKRLVQEHEYLTLDCYALLGLKTQNHLQQTLHIGFVNVGLMIVIYKFMKFYRNFLKLTKNTKIGI